MCITQLSPHSLTFLVNLVDFFSLRVWIFSGLSIVMCLSSDHYVEVGIFFGWASYGAKATLCHLSLLVGLPCFLGLPCLYF